jgi:hypothetical protein
MNKSTDTPRTDAKSSDHIGFWSCATVPSDFARQIELELAHSLANQVKAQDEVERLKGLLSDLLILTEKNYWNSNNYKMIKEAHRAYK